MTLPTALAAHNAAVALARAAYWAQTHCHVCGAFVRVDPSQRDGRLCGAACRAEAERARKRARKGAKC